MVKFGNPTYKNDGQGLPGYRRFHSNDLTAKKKTYRISASESWDLATWLQIFHEAQNRSIAEFQVNLSELFLLLR